MTRPDNYEESGVGRIDRRPGDASPGASSRKKAKLLCKGAEMGGIFILDTNDVGTAMFANGQKVESDID